MKHVSAIITALLITTAIGLGIMVIGVSAINNPNSVPLQNSPSTSTGSTLTDASAGQNNSAASTPTQVQQLQQQVSNLQLQLNQAGAEIQQYQSLILALQQRGIIAIDRNGNIFLNQNLSSDH